VDEDQEITRYLSGTLILLGLLGTFYGLATTVPALVETIRGSPRRGGDGADIFGRLQAGWKASSAAWARPSRPRSWAWRGR
jgi:hypothetical protein